MVGHPMKGIKLFFGIVILSLYKNSVDFGYHVSTAFHTYSITKRCYIPCIKDNHLTISKVSCIIENGDDMENFMKHSFTIGQITFANIVKAGTGAMVHKNRKSHGLALFLGGERTFYFDNKKIKVEGNTIVYFPKGSNYTIKEQASFDCYAINFEMPDAAIFAPFSFKVKNAGAYIESFKQARRHQAQKQTGYDAKIKSELFNIIYNMQSEHQIPYASSKVIEPAVNYIHQNYYKENISIPHLADLCGISSVYLRNIFTKKYAVSPVKYINDLKMTRAKELLSSQFYTVREVCFLSGYHDESYFSREFKKHFDITPSEYMKTCVG